MRRHHRLLAAPALALAATTLVACGGGSDDGAAEGTDEGDFCDRIESFQENFNAIEGEEATLDDFQAAVDSLGNVSDEAPDDLSSDFDALGEALQGFVDGLAELDVDPSEPFQAQFETIAQEDPAAVQELTELLGEFDNLEESTTNIEEGVLDECDIDLSEDAGGSDSGSGGGE